MQGITVKWTLCKRWSHKRYSGGFRCKRSDGTTQEADLSKDLVMDGETYGSVKSYSNLGNTLDGNGRADSAATARIRNRLMKFREIMPFLTS